MTQLQEAVIHHFDGTTHDPDGELMLGFYWQLLDKFDLPTTGMMGPFCTGPEAEADCQKAFDNADY